MTIWSMRIACWITKAINILLEYVIRIAFLLQQWLKERLSMSRYTYIACLLLDAAAPDHILPSTSRSAKYNLGFSLLD